MRSSRAWRIKAAERGNEAAEQAGEPFGRHLHARFAAAVGEQRGIVLENGIKIVV